MPWEPGRPVEDRCVERRTCAPLLELRRDAYDRVMSSRDAVWREMSRQVSLDRLQQLAVVAFKGADPGPLTEAERYFFDRLCAEAKLHPGTVLDLLDL